MKEKFEKNKRLIISLLVIVLIISIGGGSLAYFFWEVSEEQKTLVNLQVPDAELTITGENITHTGMYPTDDCDGEAALIGEVATVTAENGTSSDMEVSLKIRASLSSVNGVLNNSHKSKINFALVDTSDGTTCSTTPYKGTLSWVTTNTDIYTGASFIVPRNSTTTKTYRLYVWLDASYEYINVGDDVTDPMENLNISVKYSPASSMYQIVTPVPILDDGMIPVKISANGIVTTVSKTDPTWYNYSNKEWANIVLVKTDATSGTTGSYSREYYKNNPGTTVLESDILAYYVWIPRYYYSVWSVNATQTTLPQQIGIAFEWADSSLTQDDGLMTHPAFVWDGAPIGGFWVGKFETTGSSTKPTILPNVSPLVGQAVSEQFTTSLKFAGGTQTGSDVAFIGNDVYGLTTKTDSHMMKNSEWGAVAYLSHSRYGINKEIYWNNSWAKTGRSGGNVVSKVNTPSVHFSDNSLDSYSKSNSYGYYTWTGQIINPSGVVGDYASDRTLGTNASTTGNVTGVYDMSGGAAEFVMGNFGNVTRDSGFTTFPNSKYYNLYLSSQFNGPYMNVSNMTLCTLDTCGGHALYETAGWYNNCDSFVDSDDSWFVRGGSSSVSETAGIFCSYALRGYGFETESWRSVLIVGDV